MNRPCTFIAVSFMLILSTSSAGHAQDSIWPLASPYLTKATSSPRLSRELPKSIANVPVGFERRINSKGETEYLSKALHNRLILRKHGMLFNISQDTHSSMPIRLAMNNTPDGVELIPEKESIYKINYLIGTGRSKWKQNVPIYETIRYSSLYNGIDAVFHSNEQGIEYDYIISPGADPKNIKLSFEGAVLSLDKTGDLLANAGGRTIRLRKPAAYQLVAGVRTDVECQYVLSAHQKIHFALGQYNQRHALIIDPIISYGTYLGGSGAENIQSIAVDRFGSAYVTGTAVLPTDLIGTPNAFQQTATEADVIFVAKLDPSGSRFEYLTYLGGTDSTKTSDGRGIAVDNTGSAYICGVTSDSSYPTTPGAFQTFLSQVSAVISKLTPAGDNLIFSTFLGSSVSTTREASGATAITIDSSQAVYVTGFVTAPNFPVTAGAPQLTFGGIEDAFITKVSPDGSQLIYSTYLGGRGQDQACCIAVDSAGNAYIAGHTPSVDFPTTAGAYKTSQKTFDDRLGNAFVTKLNSTGTAFIYSTLLGSDFAFNDETPGGIAVDRDGNAVVVGVAIESGFPTTAGAFQTTPPGNGTPGFVTKLSGDGSHLLFSSLLGGPGTTTVPALSFPLAVSYDSKNNIVVIGETDSPQFPITSDGSGPLSAGAHGFVSILSSTGTTLLFSSYISGSNFDLPSGLALDESGNIFVSGLTQSVDFPVTAGAAQSKYGGGTRDGFIMKFTSSGTILVSTNNVSATFSVTDGRGNAFSGSGSNFSHSAPAGSYTITYEHVDGFIKPQSETQQLTAGGTVSFVGTYEPLLKVGLLTIESNIPSATFSIEPPIPGLGVGPYPVVEFIPAGTYTITFNPIPETVAPAAAHVTLAPAGSAVVQGNYRLLDEPPLSVFPRTLSFTVERDTPLLSALLVISGRQSVPFNVSSDTSIGTNWLSVGQVTSATPSVVTVTIDTHLAPGNYSGRIIVTAPDTSSGRQIIPVTLTIFPPVATMPSLQIICRPLDDPGDPALLISRIGRHCYFVANDPRPRHNKFETFSAFQVGDILGIGGLLTPKINADLDRQKGVPNIVGGCGTDALQSECVNIPILKNQGFDEIVKGLHQAVDAGPEGTYDKASNNSNLWVQRRIDALHLAVNLPDDIITSDNDVCRLFPLLLNRLTAAPLPTRPDGIIIDLSEVIIGFYGVANCLF